MRATSLLSLFTAAAVLASSGVARAEDPVSPITTGTADRSARNSAPAKAVTITPGSSNATWQKDGSLGWFVVATSLFVGTGLTGFGLGQTCDEPFGVNACTRGTSIALWGGIGVAALGTAIGLVIVQKGRARAHGETFATIKLGPLGDFRLAPPIVTR